MAKNVPPKIGTVVRIKRAWNSPDMPYVSNDKLDHAMYELRKSRLEVLSLKKRFYISLAINALLVLGAIIYGF